MIFSAVPGGTVPGRYLYPGLASWATLSRPFGTQFTARLKSCHDTKSSSYPDLKIPFCFRKLRTSGLYKLSRPRSTSSGQALRDFFVPASIEQTRHSRGGFRLLHPSRAVPSGSKTHWFYDPLAPHNRQEPGDQEQSRRACPEHVARHGSAG